MKKSSSIQNLQEDDYKLLYQASQGNPLELAEILSKLSNYLLQSNLAIWNLRSSLKTYLNLRKAEILLCHERFMENRSEDFKYSFNKTLIHLDAKTNIYQFELENPIKVINKQYMFINPRTHHLEAIYPAVSVAFETLKNKDFIQYAISTIVTNPQAFDNDTIGKLLERSIRWELTKEVNKFKTLEINYIDYYDNSGSFCIHYEELRQILNEEDVPQRPLVSNTLFIPAIATFECIDLLYYHYETHIFYPIQITIALKSHKNSHGDFEMKYSKLWKKALTKNNIEANMQFVWIGGEWNRNKISDQVAFAGSPTANSWKVEFLNLRRELRKTLRIDDPVNTIISKHIPKVIEMNEVNVTLAKFELAPIKKNGKEETFKTIVASYFSKILTNRKGPIEIYYFKHNFSEK